MGERWTFSGEPVSTDGGTVTLLEGSSFCLSSGVGDVVPGRVHGLFARDVRLLSTWAVRVDAQRLQPLAVLEDLPFRATFLARLPGLDGIGDPGLVVERTRSVSGGMSETLRLRNGGPRSRRVTLELEVDADLADVFEVKEARVRSRPPRAVTTSPGRMDLSVPGRRVEVLAPGAEVVTESLRGHPVSTAEAPARLRWDVELPARGAWSVCVDVRADLEGHVVAHGSGTEAASRLREWSDETPVLTGADEQLRRVLDTSRQDLGALRLADPERPAESAVAAGAPWFMALFGRDSLLTSWMALPVDPRLASTTLRVLARHQGAAVDPRTEEQPGRILHELRAADGTTQALGRGEAYYGSVDATPLFVHVLGELRAWGLGDEALGELLPSADRALAWCAQIGDRDGDGFIEYLRHSEQGLPHQGWRDSADAITYADGTAAEPPLALAEVQAYWYGALRARAAIARSLHEDPREWDDAADVLQQRFDEAFWMPQRGCYAVALDADKRQVDAVTSADGHCLWTGIVPASRAASVGRVLLSPALFSGWGLRTLAGDMGAYDPLGYHSGGVWPHDTAIAAAGLMRYGLVDESRRLCTGLLDAASTLGGRVPELLCGFDRTEYPAPVPYPAACSPQAWASAAPLLVLRTLLRFDVDTPAGRLWIDPVLPPRWQPLVLANVPVAGQRLVLAVDAAGDVDVQGLDGTSGSRLTVHRTPRPVHHPWEGRS